MDGEKAPAPTVPERSFERVSSTLEVSVGYAAGNTKQSGDELPSILCLPRSSHIQFFRRKLVDCFEIAQSASGEVASDRALVLVVSA